MNSLVNLSVFLIVLTASQWHSLAAASSLSSAFSTRQNPRRSVQDPETTISVENLKVTENQYRPMVFKAPSRDLLQRRNKELLKAVEEGNSSYLKKLLEEDEVDTEVVNRRGFTPLILAALHGDLVIVRLLVEAGAQIDAQSDAGLRSLHVAAARGHLDVIQYLIQQGAKVSSKTKKGVTPLLFATRFGKGSIVHFLLENGALLNSTTNAGFNALHLAALYGHLSVIQYLIHTAKASVNKQQNSTGVTALFLAAQSGFPRVVEVLVDAGADPNLTTLQNVSPLFIASQQGHVSVVELLIKKGADLDTQETRHGGTALIIAVCNGHDKIVRTLVQSGADLETRTRSGSTAIMCGVHWGFISILQFLQRKGANLDTHNRRGRTALHIASSRGDRGKVIVFLLNQGAEIESKDHAGHTPLHLASSSNQTMSARLLLERGAQVEARTSRGETSLHIASRKGFVEVIELLLDYNADIESRSEDLTMTPLMVAAYSNREEAVGTLLKRGASTLARTDSKATALHLAVTKQIAIVILRRLTTRRGELSSRDIDGDTPLAYASIHGNLQAVKFLISKGSDVSAMNNKGQTAKDLICACLEFSKNYVQCLEMSCNTKASRKKLREFFNR